MIGIYGWGVVAPGAATVGEFDALLGSGASALGLAPELGLGRRLFMVGNPKFDFQRYRGWIEERHGAPRFSQLEKKMGDNALFAIGAAIQAIESNPGLEKAVREADQGTHIYIGSGVGDVSKTATADAEFRRASRAWNRYWSAPERCEPMRRYLESGEVPAEPPPPPPSSFAVDSEERWEATQAWDAYWAARSEALAAFEARYATIEATLPPQGSAPLDALKARQRSQRKLIAETGCPPPPWTAVDPMFLWAIQNVPAAQITMLLGVHGPAWAPVGACSTFGVTLKLGYDAIERGEAKIAIVGTTDGRPHPALVSAFHQARLVPGNGAVNYPMTGLLGTHVSGGSCIWVLGDSDYMARFGLAPVGPAVGAVAISSDAEHIITPSLEGPKVAIRRAMAKADVAAENVAIWDLHATGTPGDLAELGLLHEFMGDSCVVSARKGVLGHGMANCGGWELTALALDLQRGRARPYGMARASVNRTIAETDGGRIPYEPRPLQGEVAGKLMLGIGGITACVLLRKNR
jgi:3-oxoacyl-(acyl-carrier-protein) synthase